LSPPIPTLCPYTTLFRSAEDQHMVQRLAAGLGGLDVDIHLLAHRRLAQVIGQAARTDAGVGDLVFPGGASADDAVVSHRAIMRRSEEHTSELQSRENLVC